MSQIKSVILADNRPANLPLPEDIVQLCRDAGYDYNIRGIPIVDQSRGVTSAWVKYNSTMAEALTQDWVAKVLNANPDAPVRIPTVYHAFEYGDDGYIVMEYIDGPLCDDSDVLQVAAAVECLINVKGPTTAPGPVGGGPIVHRFFIEWNSLVTYDTVGVLEKHINGILAHKGVPERVSFKDEVRDGLRLCPCDINRTNFKKGQGGKVVALDFGATCFLPPSFFACAMALAKESFAIDSFTQLVARHVKYPSSPNLNAMMGASYYLVPFGTNIVGLPRELRPKAK